MNENSGSTDGKRLSRRQLVTSGLFAIGGSSLLVDSTSGRFTDAESAGGTVRVTGEPSLDYQIVDETQYNVQYEIGYQVEWVTDFEYIDIQVENLDQSYGETTSPTTPEGTVSYPSGGGSDGRASSTDTFRFTFRVYEKEASDPVIEETVTDTPDGEGKQRGDFGDGNSSQFNWVMIEDNRNNSGARFDVYYELDAGDDFGEVRVRFNDKTQAYGKQTTTNDNSPNGVVSYSSGGTGGDTFDIIVEAVNQNGLVVDSVEFEGEVADGEDPETYGDPVRSDSPQLDSFTLSDDTDNSGAKYSLEYVTSNTDRFGGARVTFENEDQSWATRTKPTDSEQPDGTVSYSQGGANGNSYTVTVEVLETRNGVTFPIDRGSLQDTAAATEDGSETKTWPEDAD